MESTKDHTPITPESVLAAVKEMLAASSAKLDRDIAASRAEFNIRSADFDLRMKKLSEQIGGISNNHGRFAEDYFINSFENGKTYFFGEKFEDLDSRVKGIEPGFKDEYDILLINGKSVGIVEVKFKARDKDIDEVMKKVRTFKINFPKYQNHGIYLGLAAMVFDGDVEKNCIENGIAVIKQVGEAVVINDKHLKIF